MYKFYVFKNSLKSIYKHILQLVCCTLVLALGIAFSTAIILSSQNAQNNFYKYQKQTNLHEFVLNPKNKENDELSTLVPKIYNTFTYDKAKLPESLKNLPLNTPADIQNVTKELYLYFQQQYSFIYQNNSTTYYSDVINNHDITYISSGSWINKNNDGSQKLDTPFLQTGNHDNLDTSIINPKDCYVNEQWAKKANKKIGDYLDAFGQKFLIQGFAISPVNLSLTNPDFYKDPLSSCFVILNEDIYKNIVDSNNYKTHYALDAKFNGNYNLKQLHKKINEIMHDFNTMIIPNTENPQIFIKNMMILESWSSGSFTGENGLSEIFFKIKTNILLSRIILAIIFIYSLIIIYIFLKRFVNNLSKEIGVLKSLGYRNYEIIFSYSAFAFLIATLSAFFGYVIGFGVQAYLYNNLNIAYPGSPLIFSFAKFIGTFVQNAIFIYSPSLLFLFLFIRKSVQKMVIKEEDYKNNFLSSFVSYSTQSLPFKFKFPIINSVKALGKIFLVFATINVTTIFCLFSLTTGQTIATFSANSQKDIQYKYSYDFQLNYGQFKMSADTPTILSKQDLIDKINNGKVQKNFNQTLRNKELAFTKDDAKSFLISSNIQWQPYMNSLKTNIELYCQKVMATNNDFAYPPKLDFGIVHYNSSTDLPIFQIPLSYTLTGTSIDIISTSPDLKYKISEFKSYITKSEIDKLGDYKDKNETPIIISSLYAKIRNLHVGSMLPTSLMNSKFNYFTNNKVVIANIYEDSLSSTIYTTDQYMQRILPLPDPKTSENFNSILSKEDISNFPGIYSSIAINPSELPSLLNGHDYLNNLLKTSSIPGIYHFINSNIKTTNILIQVFIILSTIWNLIILILISTLIIEEHGFFISIMKILGYSNRNISTIFAQIYIWPIIIGFLVALPIEYGLLQATSNLMAKNVPFTFSFNMAVWQIFTMFAIILMLCVLCFFISYAWIRKINYLKISNSQ